MRDVGSRLFGFWVDTLVDFGLGLDTATEQEDDYPLQLVTIVIMYSTILPGLFVSFAVTLNTCGNMVA